MVYFVIDIIRLPEAVKKYNKRKKLIEETLERVRGDIGLSIKVKNCHAIFIFIFKMC